jgi:hypothetical protein
VSPVVGLHGRLQIASRRPQRAGRGVAGWLPALTSSATASRGLF